MEKNVWPWLVLLVIVVLVYLLHPKPPYLNQQQIPQISTSGEGEVRTDPDEAYAYVRIVTQGKMAREAQDYNRVLSNKVKDSFLVNGLKESDIETSTYNVEPERHYVTEKDGKERYEIVGYTVTHTFKTTVRDLEKVGEVVDDAVKAGANAVDNVVFGLSREKETKVKGEALSLASKKAKEKATAIAESLGVRLGDVLSASESSGYTPYYARYESKAMMAMADVDPSPITPGKVDVQVNVNVVYEIDQ